MTNTVQSNSKDEVVQELRIATLIPEPHETPFGEGLFQYLTYLMAGYAENTFSFTVVVHPGAIAAFEMWKDSLSGDVRTHIHIVHGHRSVTETLWTDSEATMAIDWIREFESNVDVWFTIRPDYAAIKYMSKPVVALFADFVFSEFPTLFGADSQIESVINSTRENVASISQYICFSEHVKQNHILPNFSIGPDRVSVIPHAKFDYAAITKAKFSNRADAADLIREFLSNKFTGQNGPAGQSRYLGELLKKFPFEQVPYVFLSTQARPHKNASILLRAAEILRREYFDLKYFMTAALDWLNPAHALSRRIIDKGLQWDVMSIERVPPDVHAALYYCSAMTVHTSPFEGGLPFTIGESLSFGSPILIADGAVAREFIAPADRDLFFFDPASPNELAERMKHTVANRDELCAKQLEVWNRLPGDLHTNTTKIARIAEKAARGELKAPPGVGSGLHLFGASSPRRISSSGWHGAEGWGRWSAEKRAHVSFRKSRESNISAVELGLSLPPHPSSQLYRFKIILNGAEQEFEFESGSWGGEINVALDAKMHNGLNVIIVESGVLYRPCDILTSADERKLGVGLRSVTFS